MINAFIHVDLFHVDSSSLSALLAKHMIMDVYLLSDMNMECHEGKPSQTVYNNCSFREVLILKDNNRDIEVLGMKWQAYSI